MLKNLMSGIIAVAISGLPIFAAFAESCPDGYTESLAPVASQSGYAKNARGRCMQLCQNEDMDTLYTANGYNVQLFADQGTSPAIAISYNGDICFADLEYGDGPGINVQVGDDTYHTVIPGECTTAVYTLRYSCGEGATGTPPPSETLPYGGLFSVPWQNDQNTCSRVGYRITRWEFDDGTSVPVGGYATYNFTRNKRATAIWEPVTYTIFFDCGSSGTATSTAQYGDTVTPTGCNGASVYKVRIGMYATDIVVNANEPFTYNYISNIVLEKQ